jgi:FkbM family methyltransferase
MRARVEAIAGKQAEINPADEGDAVVDDHELLVVAVQWPLAGVERAAHAGSPTEDGPDFAHLAPGRPKHRQWRSSPGEYAHLDAFGQLREQIAQDKWLAIAAKCEPGRKMPACEVDMGLGALERLVEPGAACADVGAHFGFHSLLMARLAGPDGRVVAFEASPENAEMVRLSARRNAAEARIDVRQVAVSDGRAGSVTIYAGRAGGGMEWTMSREFAEREDTAPTNHAVQEVPAVALDEAFPAGTALDVVKMDIEGGEALALAGAARVLREQRPVFVIEFHREVGWPAIELLLEAGYRLEALDGQALDRPADAQAVPYQFVARPG